MQWQNNKICIKNKLQQNLVKKENQMPQKNNKNKGKINETSTTVQLKRRRDALQ